MSIRERLHTLVDNLPDNQLEDAERYLFDLREGTENPFLRALMRASTRETESISDTDEAGLQEAYDALERGDVISDEELWRRLGHET